MSDFSKLGDKLRSLKLGDTTEVRQLCADALVPLRDQVKRNVHSISGRTVAAVEIVPARNGAAVKVDSRMASVMSRGRPLAYPRVVESGHGGKHAAPAHPFFEDAVRSSVSLVQRRLADGVEELIARKAKGK